MNINKPTLPINKSQSEYAQGYTFGRQSDDKISLLNEDTWGFLFINILQNNLRLELKNKNRKLNLEIYFKVKPYQYNDTEWYIYMRRYY